MARGLSVDLRKRVVGAYRRGEGSWERLAKRFGVSRSSVERWLKKEKETGSVEPLAHGGGKPALLDAVGHELLRAMLQEKPDRTIAELRQSYQAKTGQRVGHGTMWRAVDKLGWRRKKKQPSRRNNSEMK